MTTYLLIIFFALVYLAVIFESVIRINKAAAALFGGAILWLIYFTGFDQAMETLTIHLGDISQIIFFLLGAMTIVELIDSHHGFALIIRKIVTRSGVKLVWIIGLTTFFVSAVLDNLTATIVMVSLLRRMVPERADRWLYGSIVVLAANAGGAWTPIGDVTTTLLWIRGNLTTLSVMRSLFIPSIVSLLVVLSYCSILMRGRELKAAFSGDKKQVQPGARLTFCLGIGALIFVPIFKGVTGIPPFLAMFIGVGILWVATDLWHAGHHDRDHLKIPHALTRIDTAATLFFTGILLAVAVLESAGLLEALAQAINTHIRSYELVAIILGFISAVIDNVPLVAASISMYPLSSYPPDSPFWDLIAYCAGTGGSMLIIGSAAGVALMSLEKVSFFWYAKRITPIACVSYLAGAVVYILLANIAPFL